MGLAMDDAKFMWLRLFFGDMGGQYSRYYYGLTRLTFHTALGCNLAMMEAANETFLRRRRDSPRALLCLARTFACMQKRLHSSDALSDSTLTIVVSLISQQQMLSDIPGAKIHIEGLRQMIELRGGIDQLEDNPPLLMKICKMDIVFALEYGGSTAFFRDRLSEVRQNLSRQGFELDLEAAASMVHHTPVKSELYDVLLDALSLGLLFNQDLEAGSIGLHSFQEILVSICYRLLRIRPLDEPRLEFPLDSEYHIGLVLFIITIFLQYDNRRVLNCTLVLDCLKDTLIGPLENGQPELRLWLMVMGGIWTSGDSEIASWMFPLALDTASRLGLETWMDVRTSINAYPWVNRLHDRSGEELWKQITSHL